MEAAQLASRDHEVVICTRICTMFSRSYKTLQSNFPKHIYKSVGREMSSAFLVTGYDNE